MVTSRPLSVVPVRLLDILSIRVPTLPVEVARTNRCPRLVMLGMHSME